MKVRSSLRALKRRHPKNYMVFRKGRICVRNKYFRRYLARQGK